MNFKVRWMRPAIDSLARAYMAARDEGEAESITSAMAEVDRVLETGPAGAGESRTGAERILVVRPVVVEYEVFADEQTVVVTAARYVRPRGA
jgi:hypothetical protein